VILYNIIISYNREKNSSFFKFLKFFFFVKLIYFMIGLLVLHIFKLYDEKNYTNTDGKTSKHYHALKPYHFIFPLINSSKSWFNPISSNFPFVFFSSKLLPEIWFSSFSSNLDSIFIIFSTVGFFFSAIKWI